MPLKIMPNGEKKVILSYSSYSVYIQCPLRYKREKIDREKPLVKDNSFSFPGLILHEAAEDYIKTKGESPLFSEEKLKGAVEEYASHPDVFVETSYGTIDKVMNLVLSSGKHLENFLSMRLLQGHTLLSEFWFGNWEHPLWVSDILGLQGAPDLVEITDNNGAIVYDFKTTYTDKYLNSDQIVLYTIGCERVIHNFIPTLDSTNINIQMGSFFLLPLNKQHYMSVTKGDEDRLLGHMQKAAKKILDGDFPATPNDRCNRCPFYDTCSYSKDYVEKKREIQSIDFSQSSGFEL